MTGVSKQRLVYIDTAKGVGMSMIVWMHIWGNNSYGFTPPLCINGFISTIYVPLFFVLSGYLVSIKEIDLRKELTRKAKATLRPFCIVYILSFLMFFFLNHIGFGVKHIFEWRCFFNPVLSRTFFNGPIWFLLALFWAFTIYYSIMKICRGKEWIVVVASLSVGIVGFYLHRMEILMPLFLGQGMVAAPLLMTGSEIKKYLSPFMAHNKWRTSACLLVSVAIYLLFRQSLSFQSGYFNGYFCKLIISVAGGSIAIICLSILLEKYMAVFSYWGKYSIIVLCFHNYVLIPSTKVTAAVIDSSMLWAVVNFVSIYIAFMAIIPLVGRLCPNLFNIKK